MSLIDKNQIVDGHNILTDEEKQLALSGGSWERKTAGGALSTGIKYIIGDSGNYTLPDNLDKSVSVIFATANGSHRPVIQTTGTAKYPDNTTDFELDVPGMIFELVYNPSTDIWEVLTSQANADFFLGQVQRINTNTTLQLGIDYIISNATTNTLPLDPPDTAYLWVTRSDDTNTPVINAQGDNKFPDATNSLNLDTNLLRTRLIFNASNKTWELH